MMQPEHVETQATSDDEWSVVDEPETHLNKVKETPLSDNTPLILEVGPVSEPNDDLWTSDSLTKASGISQRPVPEDSNSGDGGGSCLREKEDVLSKINAMSITSCCRDLAAVQMQTLPVMCQPPFGSDNVAGSLEADPIEGPPSETMLHPDSSVLNGNPILDALRQNLAGPITQPGSSGAQEADDLSSSTSHEESSSEEHETEEEAGGSLTAPNLYSMSSEPNSETEDDETEEEAGGSQTVPNLYSMPSEPESEADSDAESSSLTSEDTSGNWSVDANRERLLGSRNYLLAHSERKGASKVKCAPAQLDMDTRAMSSAHQLERDIRLACKPLAVESPDARRWHKILVVGEGGVGKSTFIRCVSASFQDLKIREQRTGPDALASRWLSLAAEGVLENANSRCKHHFCIEAAQELGSYSMDTAELGHAAHSHIHACQQKHLRLEQDPSRTLPLSQLPDSRVDVCLWFIRPGIFPAEHAAIVAKLSQTIHVIPIIAKADTLTQSESDQFQKDIVTLLEGAVERSRNAWLGSPANLNVPGIGFKIFQISASTDMDYSVIRSGWPIRTYPWGVLEPMASTHSDLLALKRGLFEESPELLKTVTEENFTRYRAAQVPSLWRSTRRMFSSKAPCLKKLFQMLIFLMVIYNVANSTLSIWDRVLYYQQPESYRAPASCFQKTPVQDICTAPETLPDAILGPESKPFLHNSYKRQIRAISDSLSAKVDRILMHEPGLVEYQISLPPSAASNASSSLKRLLNTSSVDPNEFQQQVLVILQNVLEALDIPARQRVSPRAVKRQSKHGRSASAIVERSLQQLASPLTACTERFSNALGHSKATPTNTEKVLESIANASEGYQKAAKSAIDWHGRGKKVRNKIAAARKRMSHKAKKALKKVKQAEKQFQRQVKTLTRKAHGFLKAMNSKRLVRRVLIANAWL